jgi:hypothetical protein
VHRATTTIVLVVLAVAGISGQATGDGEIVGRITDIQGGVIPGARVSITRGDERWQTITDAEGRFALRSLGLGTYNVTVELPGFFTRSGTVTLSPTVRRAHIGWRLEVACPESVVVIPAPREAARLAEAIVHVHIKSDDGPMLLSTRPECSGDVVRSYTAEVLNVVGQRSGSVERGSTLQIVRAATGVVLQPGEEFVALLGTGLILQVVSGRISSGGESLTGMAVEDALEVLGQWSRERSSGPMLRS